MPATILTADHYDAVRALISPDVTSAHVSDAYLGQLPIAPEAEKKVLRKLVKAGVDVDSLSTDLKEDVTVAMMHECLAILCLTVPQILEQSEIEVSTEMQEIDWKEKRAYHLEEVSDKIAEIIADSIPTEPVVTGRRLPFGRVGTQRPPENQ